MKKIFVILVASLAISSCSTRETDLQEVRFSNALESGAMTKATRQDTIQSIVEQRLPSTMDLSIQSRKTGTKYSAKMGESITIPIGKYGVRGVQMSNKGQALFGSSVIVGNIPSIKTSTEVEILKGVARYELEVQLNCVGLVIDNREVEKVELKADRVSNVPIVFHNEGNYGIAFVNGELGSDIALTIFPKDKDTGEPKTISINGEITANAIHVMQGKYYVLHPYRISKEDAGFDMAIPPITEIDLQ